MHHLCSSLQRPPILKFPLGTHFDQYAPLVVVVSRSPILAVVKTLASLTGTCITEKEDHKFHHREMSTRSAFRVHKTLPSWDVEQGTERLSVMYLHNHKSDKKNLSIEKPKTDGAGISTRM